MLTWVRRRPIAVLLGGALLLLLGPGCHLVLPFEAGQTGNSASCRVQLWQCPMVAGPARVDQPAGAPFKVVEGLNSDKSVTYAPYYNAKVAIKAVSPAVRGATLLQTGAGDWKVTTPDFLTVRVLDEVEALYVAYDSRVTTPPSWLTAAGPNGYSRTGGSLVLSIKDPATQQDLRLDLWRRNEPPGGDPIVVPGNSFGSPVFPTLAPGTSPLMYVVLVQPRQVADCAHGIYTGKDHIFSACASGDQTQPALADCQAKNQGFACRFPQCDPPGNVCALEQPLRSHPAGSLVEFYAQPQTVLGIPVAASQAQVTIGDSTSTSGVSGTLDFAYEGDLRRLTIDELELAAGSVNTDAGRFENTVLELWDAATAECASAAPPFAQPCTDYRIAAGDLQVSVSSLVDGQTGLWQGENTQPVSVHIDQATGRTFDFSGTVQVTVDTSRGPVDLTAGLNLHGFIHKVLPSAVAGEESRLTAECVEDRNAGPLLLSAAGSFQVYATSPQNLPRYEWWEDFGLVTQHLWGQTENVTIPPGALAFGSHEITLLVGDQSGLVDTDTVQAAVVDTVPPTFFSLPQDITTDVYPAGTEQVQVELGSYSARDACNPYVEVTNNAPEGGWFTPGTHTVTWRADDLRGNVTEVTQQVHVRVLGKRFPWWWIAAGAGGLLLVGGGWLALRRLRNPRRAPGEAARPAAMPEPIPAPAASSATPVWLAAGAAVMLVATGAVAAFLLLGRDGGEQAAGTTRPPTTQAPTSTAGETTTTSQATTSTGGTETTSTAGETTTSSEAATTSSTPEETTTTSEATTSSGTQPGPGLNPDGPPTYGEAKLVSGFLTDPAPYPITAGGPINLAAALPGEGCVGWAAANPDLRFEWEGEGGLLRFYYFPTSDPDSPAPDTVLLVQDPAGGWHCNDDSYGTVHPTIDINPSRRGYYQIWVGTYQAGLYPTGTLNITELDANHP